MTESNYPVAGWHDSMSSDCSFQQHLEDVVRGVLLVQDVQGVQIVLVVQIDQHLEDIVQGSEFPNGSQQPFNFSCKFLYFDQIFNLVVLF